jgi:uncharacterized surface protein with fasciclin (FAS1) repeats
MTLPKITKVALMAAFSFVFAFLSCNPDTPAPKTIVDIVGERANLSTLKAILAKTGSLNSTLQGTGTFTFIAPTDDAFTAAGITTSISQTEAQDLVKYLVSDTKKLSSEIPTADNTPLKMRGVDTAYFTKNALGISVNGAKITEADISASNGVIHVVDRVIQSSYGSLYSTLGQNSNLSLFTEAVNQTEVSLKLIGTSGSLTVFAPNNAAFVALGAPYNTIASIKSLNTTQLATLKNILLYHILPNRYYSPNFKSASVNTLLTGKSLTINTDSGIKITGIATNNTANVVTLKTNGYNVTALDGVLHTIDKVLLPQ